MKNQEPAHDYKDCRLDFNEDYVHIVQKGQFETDIYYHNIQGLTYEYAKQRITISEHNYQTSISTSNEKDTKPAAIALIVIGALLLAFGAAWILIFDKSDVTDITNLNPVTYGAIGGIVLGLLFAVLGIVMLLIRKKRPNFKTGYNELNARYHEKQKENVILRKKNLGIGQGN